MSQKQEECGNCNGSGTIPCPACSGSGSMEIFNENFDKSNSNRRETKIVNCSLCRGRSTISCSNCKGSGKK